MKGNYKHPQDTATLYLGNINQYQPPSMLSTTSAKEGPRL
jgi:hypothetical protein